MKSSKAQALTTPRATLDKLLTDLKKHTTATRTRLKSPRDYQIMIKTKLALFFLVHVWNWAVIFGFNGLKPFLEQLSSNFCRTWNPSVMGQPA